MDSINAAARAIIDDAHYMTLGTADSDGHPWVSPVWFAPNGYGEMLWVSDPDARHSRNIAVRPEVSIVVFDSRSVVGEGEGTYMSGRAERLEDSAELERCLSAFSARSVDQGAGPWGPENVRTPAISRLYRAVISECWLGRRDERHQVSPDYFDAS